MHSLALCNRSSTAGAVLIGDIIGGGHCNGIVAPAQIIKSCMGLHDIDVFPVHQPMLVTAAICLL